MPAHTALEERRRPLRVAVQLTPEHTTWPDLRDAAVRAEEAGVDIVFNWDHFHPLTADRDGAHFECWTTLAAWAERTERVELGPLVSAIGYRNPDLLADMARTVDHISGGRLVLGVGAGFRASEYARYGYEFGTPRGRIDALDVGLHRIRRRLERLNPAPTRRLPLVVGGGGERRTLRVVAEHADVWNTFAEGDAFRRKAAALDAHCRDVGRDPSSIERSVLVGGSPREVGDPLVALGATLFVVLVPAPYHLTEAATWVRWRDACNAESRRT